MKAALALITIITLTFLLGCTPVLALDRRSISANTHIPRGSFAMVS